MGVWHPKPEEVFVFVHEGTGKRFVLMIPGGDAPEFVKLYPRGLGGGARYYQDDDATDKARMFVSVDNRKRAGLAD